MSIAITVHLFNVGRDALIIKAPVILMAVIIEYAFMKPDIKKTATLGGPDPIHLQRKRKSRGQNLHFSVVIYHVNRDCTLYRINRAELRHLEEKDIRGQLEDQEIKESGKKELWDFEPFERWPIWHGVEAPAPAICLYCIMSCTQESSVLSSDVIRRL